MESKIIFGFGTLVNTNSLKRTVPNATHIKACYIKGFERNFNLWDPIGFKETKVEKEIMGVPHCALDVQTTTNKDSTVNGVMFQMDNTHFEELKLREKEYNLIETNIYDFESNEIIGSGYLFSANKDNGTFNFKCMAQLKYLDICLEGAKEFGNDFYTQFLKSTYIENKPLNQVIEIKSLI